MSGPGCYSLHIYCDSGGLGQCALDRHNMGFPREFTGDTRREAEKAAMRAGWLLSFDRKHDLCPPCGKGKRGAR